MVVSGDTVFITDTASDQPVEARGFILGNSFTTTSNTTGSLDGVSCTFNWTYSNTISGNTASGTITGPVNCFSAGTAVTFTTSNGSFTGSTGSAKALVNRVGMLENVVDFIK